MRSVSPTPDYRERLVPGPGLLAAAACAGLLILVVLLPVAPVAAIVAGVVVAVAGVAWMVLAAPVVEVVGAQWRAGRAHVPVSLLGDPVVVADRAHRDRELGARLDARAHVVLVSSIATGVRVALDDPQDPTPYWLVSTRRPQQLAAALRAAGARTDQAGPDEPRAVTPEA
ncbi:DUF3093 family protein [Xylanimonas ulmi]|uniref:DUF3093 family protein n=1 Tax=Xylanimonas ulmi TaxID=228973 RepID=A0A4Q7M387_9MICO|nr:DUF3093 family protein [Xylanibacterium ulmi]RZS61092.1 DUF3093 family protein [Xylanibacterium ulmi]